MRRARRVSGGLDLASEVGVAGGVDQVDLDVLPRDRGRLGQDRDAPLALLVVGVHHPIDHRLVGGEGAGGVQKARPRAWSSLAGMGAMSANIAQFGGVHDLSPIGRW